MKLPLILFVAAYATVFSSPTARAEIIGIETFDYADGAIAGQSGGTSWDWNNSSGSANHTGTASDWDDVVGAAMVVNGKLVTAGAAAKREYNGPGEGFPPSDEGDGAVNTGTQFRQVYYRVEVSRDYLSQSVGMSSYDFDTERLFFGVPFSSGAQKFGIEETGIDRNESPMISNSPQTYTLVAKLDFDGQLVSLWVNPDLSQPEGSSAATTTRPYTATNWSTAIRLNSAGQATWDNLVVATEWEDLKVIDPGAGMPLAAETRLGAGGENAHDDYFYDYGGETRLNNGNIVVTYNSRNNSAATPPSPDGDGYGGYFRIYTPGGSSPSTEPVAPYLDNNPSGTGWQRRPISAALVGGGFVVSWNSSGGPTDVGPGTGSSANGDAYARVYAADGTAVSATFKVNESEPSGFDDDQSPIEIIPLSGGGFAIVWDDENDQSNNKDDYFVRAFSAVGVATGPSVRLGDSVHDAHFQTFGAAAALSDGGYVVCWTTRHDSTAMTSADGDFYGIFFQTFNANGTAESAVTFPYVDVNASGTGYQVQPLVTGLASGFAMSWSSFGATGDLGGDRFSGGDVYVRVYDNSGTATTGTAKVNDLTTEWNDTPVAMTTLTGGNFVIAWKDGEDEKPVEIDGPNEDDYFVRTYSAAGVAQGASVQLGDAVHELLFQDFGNLISLSDGGFAACWRTRDSNNNGSGTSADGAGYGTFLQAFNADGTDRSGLVIPYLDINPAGTGSQNDIRLTPLLGGGIAAVWNSAYGPGDIGAGSNSTSGGDTYTRLFSNAGTALGATQQAHVGEPTGFDEEQAPRGIVEADGSYAVIFFDQNRNPANDNKDDLFIRFFSTIAPASSGSGPIFVTNTADSGPGSLRAAIEDAPASKGTINFDPSLSGQIIQLLGGELSISSKTDLAIDASNLADGIIIDGFNNARVFGVTSDAGVAMHYLGISGGNDTSGGGIYVEGANLDVTHSTIWGNSASNGGGVSCNTNLAGTETAVFRRCTIANNTATGSGGGLRNQDGLTRLISCTVSGNTSGSGGAGISTYGDDFTLTEMFATISRDNNGTDVELSPDDGTNPFQSNGSNIVGTGSAVGEFVETGDLSGTATPINLTSLNKFGGPTMTMHPRFNSPAVNPANAFVTRSDQRGFPIDATPDIGAVEYGCYVYNDSSGGTGSLAEAITDCPDGGHITFDPGLSGGQIFVPSGDIDIGKRLTIDASPLLDGITLKGSATNRVFDVLGNGHLTLKKLTIADGNEATENGGGIFVSGPGSLIMFDCTIRDCSAPCAGAITSDGFVTLIRTTLSGNTATTGGAICCGGASVLTLKHSTVSGNTASNGGGGIAFFDGTLNLENSIVAGNSAPIQENLTNSPTAQTNSLTSGNPKLAPLGDFGGPTFTMMPLPGSPAINTATGSTDLLDQRGQFRDIFPDIGSTEFRGGTDLATIWETDFDNDGNNFGMEHALGTDPFVADTQNIANPQVRYNGNGDAVIEFGYNIAAVAETTWILQRSYNLDPNDWEQVYISPDPDNGETTDFDILLNAATSVELTDITAPSMTKRAFYRFVARLEVP